MGGEGQIDGGHNGRMPTSVPSSSPSINNSQQGSLNLATLPPPSNELSPELKRFKW
jgi:hypothetical protein